MPLSNTSPNEVGFGGILQPLVDVLARTPREKGRLAGQDVVLPRHDVSAIIALDSAEDVHLLLAPIDGDTRYTQLNFRGLRITEREWAVAGRPAQRYLDVSCATGTSPTFRRPFLRFAEDVLLELVQSGASAAESVFRTGLRWRRFWSPDSSGSVSTEWLYGLFGELSFLTALIERFGPQSVTSWSGPLGRPHDFQAGTKVAVEVKASSQMPFTIHCGLSQLDPAIFNHLFLVCYRLSPDPAGETLPTLVKHIERLLASDEAFLDRFYEALAATGYRRDLEPVYLETPLSRSDPALFEVNDEFPSLTERNFVRSPDHRISDIRYTLTITGVPEIAFETIAPHLEQLSAGSDG
ncbi:MAG TPA: PD-(D/E)XK motif protein [Thermoanaerobaculia bacterium]|jgi:hypothetical protein